MDDMTISEVRRRINELRMDRNKALSKFMELQDEIIKLEQMLFKEGYYDGEGTYVLKCQDMYKIGYSRNVMSYLESTRHSNPYPVNLCMFIKEKRVDPYVSLDKHVRSGWYRLDPEDLAHIAEEEHKTYEMYTPPLEVSCSHSVGTAKAIREETKAVLDVIQNLTNLEADKFASISDVLELANQAHGITEERAKEIISRLRHDGSIFEPKCGYLKIP